VFDIGSDTYLTATIPAGALSGPVTVATPTGTRSLNRNFLVKPQVESFSPPSAVVGSTVTITGVSLTQTTLATVGGKAASFSVISDTEVTATVPAGAKTGDAISVTTAGGTASSTAKLVVEPEITSFAPKKGPVGASVTITGHNFTGATAVTFGGVAAAVTVVNDTKIDAQVPPGAVTGPIAVTTAGGTGTSTTSFTVK
jgi:large repetitive protein